MRSCTISWSMIVLHRVDAVGDLIGQGGQQVGRLVGQRPGFADLLSTGSAGDAGLVFLGGRHEVCGVSGCHGRRFQVSPRESCVNCAMGADRCNENIISAAPGGGGR